MAYRKIIRINPYSRKSIINAIKELEEQKREQEQLYKMFMLHLAEHCKEHLQMRFNAVDDESNVVVSYQIQDSGKTISLHANGDQVAFIEFGAGIHARDGKYELEHPPFTPGSYSVEHAHTYQAWERSGQPMELYPYNQLPAGAFDSLVEWMHDLIKEAADEVFR